MKKLLFALLLSPFYSQAQYTLEAEFVSGISVVNFSSTTPKIMELAPGIAYSIKLYDAPNSLWKTLYIPILFQHDVWSVSAVSDHLFNSDGLVEYAVIYRKTGENVFILKIFQENNTTPLLEVPDAVSCYPILVDDNGTYKLAVSKYSSGPQNPTNLYALPGELPCVSCSGLKVPNTNKTKAFISEPIPNPSNGTVTINYMLPASDLTGFLSVYSITGQTVKELPISSARNSITVETNLSSGTYLYNIKAGGSETETKKLIIK